MKAVVMAGGEGTRLRPLTSNQPKPMVPIFNKPVIEYIIELLKKHNITDIIFTLQFLPQLIKHYYGDGSDLGVKISYAIEDFPLGTAGSIKNCERYINETFLVISGDAVTDINIQDAVKFHHRKKAMATIVLKREENPLQFGVVITDKKGRIQRFLEKPSRGGVFSDTVNTGIYVLEPQVFKFISPNEEVDFSHNVFPKLLQAGMPLYGYVADGYWCDIGSLQQYVDVHKDILQGLVKIKPAGIKMKKKIWVGEEAEIHPSAVLEGPAVIGQYARIEKNVHIGGYTTIGNNVVVKSQAQFHRAIILENTFVGSNTSLDGCVVGRNCDIKSGSRITQGVVVGDECSIGENAVINHDVKIYPFKSVEAGAIVNNSIIWESKGKRSLFGRHGISGMTNIDVTPELAMRVAMAYGTSLPKESMVCVSRDSNRSSRIIKRAILTGLNSTGIHCRDLRVAPTPVNRFNVHTSRCMGGVHVRVSPFDPQSVEINFFGPHGINLDEKRQQKIERYFYHGDVRRAFYNEVGEIIFPSRTSEFYVDGLLKNIDKEAIRKAQFKVIIDYAFGGASLTIPFLIGKLGCEVVSLNAFTDETKTTLTQGELENSLQELSQTVEVFQADFGILIDSGCEKIYLIDNKGNQVSHNSLLHLLVALVCRFEKNKGKIAVPLSCSSVVGEIAKKHRRKVLRTKVNEAALMKAALRRDVAFAGAQGGGFIFPRFLPAYDGTMTFCKLMNYLAYSKKSLSELLSELPPCHLEQSSTFCSWDNTGLVMRTLVERSKGKRLELTDGVKIHNHDVWTLILPHSEEPIIRVFAEADSQKKARVEVDKYINLVHEIANGK